MAFWCGGLFAIASCHKTSDKKKSPPQSAAVELPNLDIDRNSDLPSVGRSAFDHFLQQLLDDGKLILDNDHALKGKRITYHDSCYLGRANKIYEAPRSLIKSLQADLVEMERHKETGLCCGAGGAQMFKEPEKGNKDINIERTEEALATGSKVIASACPFCMTMMTDGVKNKEREEDVKVLDIVELIAESKKL